MPRRPCILLPGYPLHIVQRGMNREPCFFAEEDYPCYLHWLEEAAHDCGCAVHAYALMPHHVHLLLTRNRWAARTLQKRSVPGWAYGAIPASGDEHRVTNRTRDLCHLNNKDSDFENGGSNDAKRKAKCL